MKFKGFISYQISPLNGREPDSAMFVFDKMVRIIKSCENVEQLRSVYDLTKIFYNRFPDHYEFVSELRSEILYKNDQLIKQFVSD